MILPNDILIRATSDGQTVWVSQRMVCEACGVDEEVLRVSTKRYKSSLPPSWRKVADQSEFFLGKKEGTIPANGFFPPTFPMSLLSQASRKFQGKGPIDNPSPSLYNAAH